MTPITKEKFKLFVDNAVKKAKASKELNKKDLELFKDAFEKILLKKYKIKEE